MADPRDIDLGRSTSPRRLYPHVIEHCPPGRQRGFVRLEWGADAPRNQAIQARKRRRRGVGKQTQGVTYVPGLICHPCSRSDGEVGLRSTTET
jgi:hypothetical protein